jgi:SAM-dependent methyltransferase
MNKRSPYGKFSLGSGSFLDDPTEIYQKIDNPDIIDGYKTSMIRDLEKSGILLDNLSKYNILDVGTGRQSIVFEKLGAKNISHYDLSLEHVEKLKKYILKNNLNDKINSTFGDLVDLDLPKEKFDLIYLQGIVQHFSHTGRGLLNCISSLKEGGVIWLYFYRSGAWPNFLKYMIRDLIKEKFLLEEYFVSAISIFSPQVEPVIEVSNAMDNFFVSNMHLYSTNTYMDFMENCGLKAISSSRLDPIGKDVDHRYAYQSSVITYQKVDSVDLSKVDVNVLSPKESVDQLSESHYNLDIVKEIIQSYNSVKELLEKNEVPDVVYFSVSHMLHLKLIDAMDSYKEHHAYPDNAHKDLLHSLNNLYALIKSNFC